MQTHDKFDANCYSDYEETDGKYIARNSDNQSLRKFEPVKFVNILTKALVGSGSVRTNLHKTLANNTAIGKNQNCWI